MRFQPCEVFRVGMLGTVITYDQGMRPYIDKRGTAGSSINDPVVAAVMACKTLLTSEISQSSLERGMIDI